jgi:hypothetical protein
MVFSTASIASIQTHKMLKLIKYALKSYHRTLIF